MQSPLLTSVGETVPTQITTWLIIDTDRYAGNFERQLCAFVTGRYGECEVGKEVAERVLAEAAGSLDWTEDAITVTADENGCYRPVKIEQTPGWLQDQEGNHYPEDQVPAGVEPFQWAYQSVAISFGRVLSDEELQFLMRRSELFPRDESYLEWYADTPLSILGYRVVEEQTVQVCKAVYPVADQA